MIRTFLATLLMACSLAFAQEQPVPGAQRVIDQTGTLHQAQINDLASKLKRVREEHKIVIGVLMVPTTKPEDITQYSRRVFETWGLGTKSLDNGLLIVVAKDDRKMRIHVGYGVENTIRDMTARQIINETMAPRFKTGNFYGGIDAAIDDIVKYAKQTPMFAPPAVTPVKATSDSSDVLLYGAMWLGVLVLIIGTVFFVLWMRKKRKEAEEEALEQAREHNRRETRRRLNLGTSAATPSMPPPPPPVRRATEETKRDDRVVETRRDDSDNSLLTAALVTAAIVHSNNSRAEERPSHSSKRDDDDSSSRRSSYSSSDDSSSSSYSSSSDNSFSSSDFGGGSSGGGGGDGSW